MRIFLLSPRALHPPPALLTLPHSPFSLLPPPRSHLLFHFRTFVAIT